MKKSIFLGAALLIAGALGQAQAADVTVTGKVNYVWMDANSNGGFAFILQGVGPQTGINVNVNSATNPKTLSMLLTAKTSDINMVITYDNNGNFLKFIRFN